MKKLFSLFLLFIAGCLPPDNLPERKIKRKPHPGEFIGKWTITPATVQRIKDFGYALPYTSIIFRPDSTLLAIENDHTPDTVTGTWKLEENTRNDLYSNPLIQYVLYEEGMTVGGDLNITEENKRLILWIYIGDPDQVIYQDYMKQ